jgi:RNA-directed DNA polymerase
MRRWRKAGVLEDGVIEPSDEGVPHGGSVRVVRSNLYRHYVLDRWCDRIGKPRLHGAAYLMRSRDDVVVCVQHRADAERFQQGLGTRLATFAFALEPKKTRRVAFGRVAERKARGQGKRPETCTFLGLTHDYPRNHQGHFKVGWKTDQTRLRRRLANVHQLRQRSRHEPLQAQVAPRNQALRGHDAYDGVAGHVRSLQRLDANVERYWRKMLSSRRRQGMIRWDVFQQMKRAYPLQRPTLFLPDTRIKSDAVRDSRV